MMSAKPSSRATQPMTQLDTVTTIPDGKLNEILQVQDLGYAYPNGTEVLRHVNFRVPRGGRIAIIGPSGCGKSTLLALIAGLLEPTAGSMQINAPADSEHPLSMVFQKDTLLPWLTVRKNVRLYDRLHGRRRPREDEETIELLRMVGLDDAGSKYPYQLSGGMRRRTQFLSAVALRPQVLLLDEPFSSLDEPTRIELHQDVLTISDELKMTMILVTHDLAEAITLCDEIIVLTGRPATIFRRNEIPFGRNRDVLTIRERSEYQAVYADVWHQLSLQIGTLGRRNRQP